LRSSTTVLEEAQAASIPAAASDYATLMGKYGLKQMVSQPEAPQVEAQPSAAAASRLSRLRARRKVESERRKSGTTLAAPVGARLRKTRYGSNSVSRLDAEQRSRLGHFKDLEPVSFSSADVEIKYTPPDLRNVPKLKWSLNRVLQNPGVVLRYRDDRTKLINFDPQIATFPRPDELDMARLSQYTPPSQDKDFVRSSSRADALD
jgi:hypothetical protein